MWNWLFDHNALRTGEGTDVSACAIQTARSSLPCGEPSAPGLASANSSSLHFPTYRILVDLLSASNLSSWEQQKSPERWNQNWEQHRIAGPLPNDIDAMGDIPPSGNM